LFFSDLAALLKHQLTPLQQHSLSLCSKELLWVLVGLGESKLETTEVAKLTITHYLEPSIADAHVLVGICKDVKGAATFIHRLDESNKAKTSVAIIESKLHRIINKLKTHKKLKKYGYRGVDQESLKSMLQTSYRFERKFPELKSKQNNEYLQSALASPAVVEPSKPMAANFQTPSPQQVCCFVIFAFSNLISFVLIVD